MGQSRVNHIPWSTELDLEQEIKHLEGGTSLDDLEESFHLQLLINKNEFAPTSVKDLLSKPIGQLFFD